LQSKLADVEVQCLLVVEDPDVRVGDRVEVRHGPTLAGARPARFSETARSRPGHGEAGRDGATYRRAAAAGGDGRDADDLAERPAGGAQAGEADGEADGGHAAVGVAQQPHRALEPAAARG